MRKILAIITFLLFLLLLWYSYTQYQECCGSESTNVDEQSKSTSVQKQKSENEILANNKDGALSFNWNSAIAHENEYWNVKKNSILSNLDSTKFLKIIAPYFKEEGEEVGIARAKATYEKIKDKINPKRVEFGVKLIDFYEDAKSKSFSGNQYSWQIRNENITEIDNKTLIYFPTNSTKKISNANILNYLKDVVKSLKDNQKQIHLSGHTDNIGNDIANKKLALGRATSIKAELIRLGIDNDRIITVSFGEEKPIETNETKIGRQKNRRVELELK